MEHIKFDSVGVLVVAMPTVTGAIEGKSVGMERGTCEGIADGAEGAFETVGDGEG